MSRRRYEHKEDSSFILLTQLAVCLFPHLADIALDMVKVYHAQAVQPAMLLIAPESFPSGFLTGLLILKDLLRLIVGGDENHEGQTLLLGIVGLLVAFGKSLTGLFYEFKGPGRRD